MHIVQDRVIAVTVTFNDFNYLERALDYLSRQTYSVERIIVVDNNSSNENKQKLEALECETIEVLWLNENLGGAGGFEAGMRYAQEKYSPDWFWLMDADAFPREQCLENLLKYKNSYNNLGILAPMIFGVELEEYQLYHHKREPKYLDQDIFIYSSINDVPKLSLIEADAFVGPLVSHTVISDVGYPEGGLFIYGDDLEYTYRISRKYNVVLVKEAIINHRDQPTSGEKRPNEWWKDYYLFRNRILFINKYKTSNIRGLIGVLLTIKHCAKLYIISFRLPYSRKAKKLRRRLLAKGIIDGVKGYYGKNVDPALINTIVKNEISEV